jgi:hypothetical protein
MARASGQIGPRTTTTGSRISRECCRGPQSPTGPHGINAYGRRPHQRRTIAMIVISRRRPGPCTAPTAGAQGPATPSSRFRPILDRVDAWIRDRHRILGPVLIAGGLLLVPWFLYLSFRLPDTARASNWSLMWTGLDVAEALGLTLTGVLQWRRSPHRARPAAFTAALLAIDAWVDVTTSAPGHAKLVSIIMAAGVEVPAAIACLVLAVWTLPDVGHNLDTARRQVVGPTPDDDRTPADNGDAPSPQVLPSSPTGPAGSCPRPTEIGRRSSTRQKSVTTRPRRSRNWSVR